MNAPSSPGAGGRALRVLVCGGRHFTDHDLVWRTLDDVWLACKAPDAFCIIQGGATGADSLARLWCVPRRVPYEHYPADWTTHGRAAGPIRNARMLAEGKPDLVIAFPGGRGTADMVRKARAAGVPVQEVAPTGPGGGRAA